MSLYEKYLNHCQQHEDMTVKERAAIIYERTKNDSRSTSHYGMVKTYDFDQYRVFANDGTTPGLLQSIKNADGSIQLSIQGMTNVIPTIPNFLDFFNTSQREMFLKYLAWF